MAKERFVRVCRDHGLELKPGIGDSLLCPKRHTVQTWKIVDRSKGLAVSEVDREKVETAMVNEKVEVKEPEKATLDRLKFTDAAGLVLFLWLRRERPRFGGDPFRIRWMLRDGKKSATGVSITTATEPDARTRWKASLAEAIKAGWKEVPIVFGRQTKPKPIPAPRKRAS